MANELALFKSGVALPDYLRDVDDFTKRVAGGGPAIKTISIEGGVWRMMEGNNEIARNEERAMNFVVVNAAENVGRTYYTGTYQKGVASAPDCWSSDGRMPDATVKEPQSAQCQTCPQNIKGSGQGDSRACRFNRRIAVVLEGDLEGQVYRLQLPAKSMFGKPKGDKMPFNAYASFLAGHGVPMSGVVTEARFDTGEAVPVLQFRALRPLTKSEVATSRAQGASEDALAAIEFKLTTRDDSKVPAELPEAFEPPAAEPPADEAPKEPTKRASKKPDAPPATVKDTSAILDEWGSDDD
jgi:hypothetical protein